MGAATRAPRGRAATEPFPAVLAKRGRFWIANPLFGGRAVTIDSQCRAPAGAGDLVLVGGGKRGPRVGRVLGRPDVARDVLEAVMLDRGFRRAFPRAVEGEADEVALGLSQAGDPAEGRRRDLTTLPTFTIDPADAKDFDDAVSARHEDGAVRIWVHIADVSAAVRPGGAVEREAFRRGTSVYVPGAVEPMLPEQLSGSACSLMPGAERLALTAEMEVRGTEVGSVSFYRSVIRSDVRLTYEGVDAVFAGRQRGEDPWAAPLEAVRPVARALTERRHERGSLEITSTEPSFAFDEAGQVTGVRYEEQTESHRLIEELMVLANEQVAGLLADRRIPTLYRVHERPDPQAIELLVGQLESLDVATPPLPDPMSPEQARKLVGEVSRLVAAHVRRTGRGRAALASLVLRSLKPAFYSPRNLGHAGLASPRYCHFTSPIRRYPDLVAHRALLGALGADDARPRADELADAGIASSAAERAAMEVERDADDVCLAFLLERVLAEDGWERGFEGEVMGLIGAGAFVRFGEEGFEGFLPVRRLRGDWWELNEPGTALIGERSGAAMRLGDPVDVEVVRIDAPRGRVDLAPAEG